MSLNAKQRRLRAHTALMLERNMHRYARYMNKRMTIALPAPRADGYLFEEFLAKGLHVRTTAPCAMFKENFS